MPKRLVVDPTLPRLLAQQDGVVATRQAYPLGLTKAAIVHRVTAGQWRRLLPGIVLTSQGEPSRRQRVVAAHLWSDGSGIVDADSACWWHNVTAPGFDQTRVHLVVAADSPYRNCGFVVVRRSVWRPTYAASTVARYADLPVALLSAASRMTRRPASAFLHEAVQRERVDVDDLRCAMAVSPPRGRTMLWDVLDSLGAGTRSEPEEELRALVLRSRVLPEPLWNPYLRLPDGARVSPDALWIEAGLVHEVNGRRYHAWGDTFDQMQVRHDAMTVAGLTVLHNVPARIRREPGAVLREIEKCYLAMRGRGLPSGVHPIPSMSSADLEG